METQKNGFNIDISVYANQLRVEIGSDLTTLQIVTNSINNGAYESNGYTLKHGFVNSEVQVPPSPFLEQREINKCFKSIIGALQDYMDKLIAVIELTKEKIVPPLGSTLKDMEKLLQERLAMSLMSVSTRGSLNVPGKLDILLGSPENNERKVTVQSYFDIRNGFEHHKGIAKKDRVMKYKRLTLITSTTGKEIVPGEGTSEGISLTVLDGDIAFNEGGNIILTRTQLDGIVLNILMQIITPMQEEAIKKINQQHN